MAGGRRLPLQNGSHSLTSAIFVAWSLLLLYGPHGATGQTSCPELWTIIVEPVGAKCYYIDTSFAFIYQNLPEDTPEGQVYALTAQDGTTFTAFVPEGDPQDAIFETYFSASLIGTASISIDIVASLEDFTDYEEDGSHINSNDQATSTKYKLTYENGTGEQEPIVINKFQFLISDVNNELPEFESESYATSLREDWPLNIEIPDLKVKVRDRDGTGDVTLSFDAECPLDMVGLHVVTITNGSYSSEISFQLKTKLDFEATSVVTCTLTANDGLNEGTTKITINVEEGQDKPPVFDNSFYYIDVGNDDSVGGTLTVSPATIHAVDQDDPPTAITYRMENALAAVDGAEYFEINASSGEITLIKELEDFLDQQRQLHFVLFATDEVGDEDKAFLEINLPMPLTTPPAPTTSTSTTLKPTTPAPTTHTPSGPVFRKDTYVFQALKGMDSMGTVKATIDGQDSADVVYSLEDDHFEIVPTTGEVRRKADLKETSYTLTVTAIVNGLTSDPTQVKIEVQQLMDQTLCITESLHQVKLEEEHQGVIIGEVAYLPEKAATTFCVIYQDGVDSYEDIYFTFDESNNLKLKVKIRLDREREKQLLVWVQIFNTSDSDEDFCPTVYKESGPVQLLRSQSLFVIDVVDINDHKPTVDYPKGDITIAYPEDPAIQKVVGPVIQLRASDQDDTDYVRYTIKSDDEFAVDAVSGAVFWEGGESLGSSCGDDGCSFTVSAEDKDKNVSAPVTCKVVSLPADNIYTIPFPGMVLSDVEEALSDLSDELAMTVRALYVTPKPVASPARGRFTRYRNSHHGMRDGLGETLFDLEVHVSVMKDGEIVTLDNFNGELSKHDETNAELFKDKDMYILNPDETPENVAGYQIALGVTGGLMGVLLLALVIMGIIRYRNRAEKRRGPEVPDLRRTSYSNQGYVKDGSKQHDTLDSNSLAMNGSVGGFHEPPRAGGDSPPLNKSQLGITPDSSARGLRRTSPENVPNLGQPASREPPAQFKESTQQPQKETQIYTTAVSVGTAAAAPVAAKKQPAVEPALTQASTPYNTSSVSLPRKKKEPLPLTAEPKKSALKGAGGTTSTDSQKTKDPQIPLGSMAPSEPTADYETSPAKKAKTATSSFSTLKASPPPKKKEEPQAKVDEDDTDDGEDKSSSDVKKSNLKTTTDDSNDQDKKEDKERRKSSVAFKVLVEQKIIEPQNVGPAAKKQAKEEAKAEANQAAVDIMEANKKKLDDEDDEDDNSKL